MTKALLQSTNGKMQSDRHDRSFEKFQPKPSTKFAHMNHHHELTPEHEIVDFGHGAFVANKAAIPLLSALHGVGLRTRTHHVEDGRGFVSVLIDPGVTAEVRQVDEQDAERSVYDGQTEILLQWYFPPIESKEASG